MKRLTLAVASHLRPLPPMAKAGLVALADGYGLEREELQELRLLYERFFGQLLDALTPYVARPVKLIGLAQSVETFRDFCTAAPAQHLMVLGFADEPAAAFRVDDGLALALVNAVLGGSDALTGEPTVADSGATMMMTPTEVRILDGILKKTVPPLASRIFAAILGDRTDLGLIGSIERSPTPPEAFEARDQIVSAIGRYSINGHAGEMVLGIPLRSVVQVRAKRPVQPASAQERENIRDRARRRLNDAALRLEAVLGSTAMSLEAVDALVPGSVILVGRLHDKMPLAELRTGGQTLFGGTVVADRGWYRFLIQQGEKFVGQSSSS
jgi:flagellar motor switch protein FliM